MLLYYFYGQINVPSKDLENSLIDTISKSGGTDIATEAGELTLDAFLNGGLIEDVPIIGTLVKLKNVGVGIREYLFTKKLLGFLKSINNVSQEDCDSFADEMDNDIDKKKKVGESLLLLIERMDEVDKAELLGNAFHSYLSSIIDYETFFRIGRAIDRCMVSDLRFVHNYERATDAFPESAFDLASCGLIEMVSMPTIRTDDSRNLYKLTDFGELFIRCVLR